MKLDSRILKGKKPLDCFDIAKAKQFIGKKGLFGTCILQFKNLDTCPKCVVDELKRIANFSEDPFVTSGNHAYMYFLPEEWLKEPEEWLKELEKKYRVLTLNEFLERFKIGDAIYIRFKKDGAERVVVFSEYNIPPHNDEGNNTESVCLNGIEHHLKSIVCLGMREYNLTTLFDCYEYFDGKEWQPFGIEVKEK